MPYKDKSKTAECKRILLASRKEAWFAENGPCRKCGSAENLEVDHIDPSQKAFSINWGIRRDVLEIELGKCQALCEKCHIEKSALERTKNSHDLKSTISAEASAGFVRDGILHGTRNSYNYHRCRCAACRAAVAAYARRSKSRETQDRINAKQRKKLPTPANGYFLEVKFPENPFPISHGTISGYYWRGCRCEICEAFAVEKRRLEREQKAAARALLPPKPPLQIRHGTTTAYCHHACRCEICKAFMRQHVKARWQKEKASRPPKPPKEKPLVVHGTYYAYCKHACRCEACSAAAFEYREKKRAAALANGGSL
jgi:hypothetical protein